MKVYAGITIGPIVEVLCETSTPAALWFGSSMFSDITRRLCGSINKEWTGVKIYSPYFDAESATEYPNDGVGKYHDRIIFSIEDQESTDEEAFVADIRFKLKTIVSGVITGTLNIFPDTLFGESGNSAYEEKIRKAKEFLEQYLQIHFVVVKAEKIKGNAVLALSPYLDELELMKSFPSTSQQNIIVDLFGRMRTSENTPSGVNDLIRKSALFKAISKENNGFLKDKRFRTLSDIANADNDLEKKYSNYYAIVTADGDGMGRFLNSITTDEVTTFSKRCLEYNKIAAEAVIQYGGMPIYAGGDDLLFIAPVMGSGEAGKRKYIFELCHDINEKFRSQIKSSENATDEIKFEKVPTVSFGIAIRYYKYPLYEAFADSRSLLENIKYKENGPEKNSIAIGLQKHSGQSLTIYVGNEAINTFKKFFELESSDSQMVNSLLYNLGNFSVLFKNAYKKTKDDPNNSKAQFLNVWKNTYDNSGQKAYLPYVLGIADIFFDRFIIEKPRIKSYEDDSSEIDNEKESSLGNGTNCLTVLKDILKLKKFYVEKAGERE